MKKTILYLPLLLAVSLLSITQQNSENQHLRNSASAGEETDMNNPYVFDEESFEYRVKSAHGSVRLLKKFSSQQLSPHCNLSRIDNYRLGLLEADPLTFIMPTHLDADSVFYVIYGDGAISILHEGSRESHSLERGDIIRVWAGSIIYLINKSHDRKLRIVKLLQTVNGYPGDVEAFYSAGGERTDSYYQSFSIELLEAALNRRRDELQRFFAQQKKQGIIKASVEKIRAIAQQSGKSEGLTRSNKPFNLLAKRPSFQNSRGQLHAADSNDYQQLKDLNAKVAHANISGGSMVPAFFHTRAFMIALVEEGNAYLEIICPQVDAREREQGREEEKQREGKQGSRKYRRVSSWLSEGSVYVIPPGHPASIVAGRGKNLQIMCFEMPAENNERLFLAGKSNILREMEEEAKELAFGVPAKVADEVLGGQKGDVFLPGPEEWREEIRREGRRRRPAW